MILKELQSYDIRHINILVASKCRWKNKTSLIIIFFYKKIHKELIESEYFMYQDKYLRLFKSRNINFRLKTRTLGNINYWVWNKALTDWSWLTFYCLSETSLTTHYQDLKKIQKQPSEVFYKKGVLKNFAKFAGKHLCQSPF